MKTLLEIFYPINMEKPTIEIDTHPIDEPDYLIINGKYKTVEDIKPILEELIDALFEAEKDISAHTNTYYIISSALEKVGCK